MNSLNPYHYKPLSRPVGLLSDDWLRSFFWNEGPQTFRVDVWEEADCYRMEAELPGLTREQVKVEVEDDMLTISCDAGAVRNAEKNRYLVNERRYGQMSRSFSLGQVKSDEITAEYRDGVLRICLPKQQDKPTDARSINIE